MIAEKFCFVAVVATVPSPLFVAVEFVVDLHWTSLLPVNAVCPFAALPVGWESTEGLACTTPLIVTETCSSDAGFVDSSRVVSTRPGVADQIFGSRFDLLARPIAQSTIAATHTTNRANCGTVVA